jgi:O-acetyl-ADP-ribose deacetylase (regulator of RNase III)
MIGNKLSVIMNCIELVRDPEEKYSDQVKKYTELANRAINEIKLKLGVTVTLDELIHDSLPSKNHIRYVRGDATHPLETDNLKVVAHICNDVGKWGRGFVVSLSTRWKEPEKEYRRWHSLGSIDGNDFKLGNVQFVKVEPHIVVCNMIAQHDIRTINNIPPIRYAALESCLSKLKDYVVSSGFDDWDRSVHMPKIGAGLAGGDWNKIENIISTKMCDSYQKNNVDVYVYIKD